MTTSFISQSVDVYFQRMTDLLAPWLLCLQYLEVHALPV